MKKRTLTLTLVFLFVLSAALFSSCEKADAKSELIGVLNGLSAYFESSPFYKYRNMDYRIKASGVLNELASEDAYKLEKSFGISLIGKFDNKNSRGSISAEGDYNGEQVPLEIYFSENLNCFSAGKLTNGFIELPQASEGDSGAIISYLGLVPGLLNDFSEYIEYMKYIVEELPDEIFKAKNKDWSIDGVEIENAKIITFQLSASVLENILSAVGEDNGGDGFSFDPENINADDLLDFVTVKNSSGGADDEYFNIRIITENGVLRGATAEYMAENKDFMGIKRLEFFCVEKKDELSIKLFAEDSGGETPFMFEYKNAGKNDNLNEISAELYLGGDNSVIDIKADRTKTETGSVYNGTLKAGFDSMGASISAPFTFTLEIKNGETDEIDLQAYFNALGFKIDFAVGLVVSPVEKAEPEIPAGVPKKEEIIFNDYLLRIKNEYPAWNGLLNGILEPEDNR